MSTLHSITTLTKELCTYQSIEPNLKQRKAG
jgi:hypothetical protein